MGEQVCGVLSDPRSDDRVCSEADCGPRPLFPSRLCFDGVTTSGVGECLYDSKLGACAWDITTCPSCNTDKDCGDDQFCSVGECRENGTCGNLLDCQNPSNRYLTIKCIRTLQCSAGVCGIECGKPCPDGGYHPDCQSPCARSTCIGPSTCVDDFCTCEAIFFDPSGSRLC
mmetsp:Transcript_17253/g.26379  ORF Transcript_17253/g.26379 Transcript_17253/m.26379 type:complete len:171 (+) Transcript_17253:600-1112(+)